jgi:hypothetical protein
VIFYRALSPGLIEIVRVLQERMESTVKYPEAID